MVVRRVGGNTTRRPLLNYESVRLYYSRNHGLVFGSFLETTTHQTHHQELCLHRIIISADELSSARKKVGVGCPSFLTAVVSRSTPDREVVESPRPSLFCLIRRVIVLYERKKKSTSLSKKSFVSRFARVLSLSLSLSLSRRPLE